MFYCSITTDLWPWPNPKIPGKGWSFSIHHYKDSESGAYLGVVKNSRFDYQTSEDAHKAAVGYLDERFDGRWSQV